MPASIVLILAVYFTATFSVALGMQPSDCMSSDVCGQNTAACQALCRDDMDLSPQATPIAPYKSNNGEYSTQLFAHRARRQPSSDMSNITAVTHITLDRIPKLVALCDHWRGPISVSIYLRRHLKEKYETALQTVLNTTCLAVHADVHIVQLTEPKGTSSFQRVDMHTYYPFNVQRNAALRGSAGRWLLLLDIDMLIHPRSVYGRERLFSKNFHSIRTAPENRHLFYPAGSNGSSIVTEDTRHSELVVVIPAIETVNKKVPIPQTFKELQQQFSEHQSTAFYGHYCRDCHGSTNVNYYLAMMKHHFNISTRSGKGGASGGEGSDFRAAPYRVKYVSEYEPYVVVYRDDRLPLYDERFVGRGYDKMSYFYELDAQGRRFIVLAPGPYLAHHGRGDEPTTDATEEYKALQRKTKRMWAEFKEEVDAKYGKGPKRTQSTAESPPPPPPPSAGPAEEISNTAPAEPDRFWSLKMASCVDDGKPCCLARCSNASACDAIADQLVAALSYACSTTIDCSPLHTFRAKPRNIMHHADWAFNTYFRVNRQRENNTEFDESLCNFSGLAILHFHHQHPQQPEEKLSGSSSRCGKCVLFTNVTEELAAPAVDWVCGPEQLGDCDFVFSMAENVLGSSEPARANGDGQADDPSTPPWRHRAEVLFSTYWNLYWPRIAGDDDDSHISAGTDSALVDDGKVAPMVPHRRLVPQRSREVGCSFGGIAYFSEC